MSTVIYVNTKCESIRVTRILNIFRLVRRQIVSAKKVHVQTAWNFRLQKIAQKSTFELKFTHSSSPTSWPTSKFKYGGQELHFFIILYNFHFKNEDIVLFCCCIFVYREMFYKNIFRSNNIRRRKNSFLWL
jgi:hypothetical protein